MIARSCANRRNLSQTRYGNPVESSNRHLLSNIKGDDEMELAKVYKITNNNNDMIYVGSTSKSLTERFNEHVRKSRDENYNKNSLFYRELAKYPISDFSIAVLDECLLRHQFIIEEYYWNHLNGKGYALYDIKMGASHSKNTLQRLSQSRQNNGFDYSSSEFKDTMSLATRGEKNGMYNRKDESAVNGRAVYALNKEGSIVHSFPSVKVALNHLGLKGHSALVKACRSGEEYKGYYWKKEWIDR